MLTVTVAARDCLLAKLGRRKAADDVAMRFTRKKHGWRLRPDRTSPNDTAFTHQGRNVLLLDEAVSKAMADMKLDVRATAAGPRLKLRRVRNDVD